MDRVTPRQLPLLPAVTFVVVWSSGYIAGPIAVDVVGPFTTLGWRFATAAVIAVPLALALRRPQIRSRQALLRIAAVGLVMNACQFSLMYVAFMLGLGATVGSLLHSLSPVLTLLLAALLLKEPLRWGQGAGFALGVIGVVAVLGPGLEGSGGPLGALLGAVSVLTLSLGTLGQRWIGEGHDLLWSAAVQFAVSAPPMLLLGWLVEDAYPVHNVGLTVASIAYLAVINSIVGLVLLALLVVRGGSGAAASLFFLCPPVTAVLAWLILDETMGARALAGLLIAVVGVAIATRVRRPSGDISQAAHTPHPR